MAIDEPLERNRTVDDALGGRGRDIVTTSSRIPVLSPTIGDAENAKTFVCH